MNKSKVWLVEGNLTVGLYNEMKIDFTITVLKNDIKTITDAIISDVYTVNELYGLKVSYLINYIKEHIIH